MTTCIFRMAKIQMLATPNAGEDAEQQKFSSLLAGMQNSTDTLEDNLTDFYKIDIPLIYILLGIY